MKDKKLKDTFSYMSNQELTFTKEDRNEVFEQIHKMENKDHVQQKSHTPISKQFTVVAASLLVVGLCILLFVPSIFQGTFNIGTSEADPNETVANSEKDFTALFTVKDAENRIHVNLLLSYSIEKKMMKVLSIPRDTYAPILDNSDGTTSYDKLTFAYGLGGAENVRTTVSNLFDLPIDYYAVMDLEILSKMIEIVNGLEYDLEEDIQVRAISQVAFDLKKGTQRLNGEEVVALMMDATVGKSLNEKHQLHIIHAFLSQLINGLQETQLKEFTTKIESNIPLNQLFEDEMEMPAIQLVPLIDGMINTMIDESYYIKFEKSFLNSATKELTTFN